MVDVIAEMGGGRADTLAGGDRMKWKKYKIVKCIQGILLYG